jgi:hypothetical protein
VALLTDQTVDDEIGTDWAEILEKHTEEPPEPSTPAPKTEAADKVDKGGTAPAAPATGEEPPAPDAAAAARDEAGRFKKPASRPAKTEKVAAAPPADAAAEPPAGEQPARDLNRPPSTWRPTARAAWAALPEPVRAEIHKREADFMAGQSQLLPDARFGSSMQKVIEPYRMLIESDGGSPEGAVQELLRTAAVLRTGTLEQKLQTFANIANRYGINVRAFAMSQQPQQQGVPPGQQPPVYRDPRVDQLLHQLQTRDQQAAQQQAAAAQREQQQTESMVDRWMNEADASGNPKRPYVNDVINEMSAMIPALKEADPTLSHAQALELAYDRATWAHPEIRTLLQQAQQTALDAKRRTDSQTRVRDARRAASVNVPRRAAFQSPAQPGSIEETIASTARELGLIT